MRVIVQTDPNTLELNWQWLPVFIGINPQLEKDLLAQLGPYTGQPCTEDVLDTLHERVLDLLEEKFATIEGVRAYLDGLKFIRYRGNDPQEA